MLTEHDRAVLSPRKARLGAIVRSRIQDGTIKPGEPIIKPLMDELGVGRTTLRRALTPWSLKGSWSSDKESAPACRIHPLRPPPAPARAKPTRRPTPRMRRSRGPGRRTGEPGVRTQR